MNQSFTPGWSNPQGQYNVAMQQWAAQRPRDMYEAMRNPGAPMPQYFSTMGTPGWPGSLGQVGQAMAQLRNAQQTNPLTGNQRPQQGSRGGQNGFRSSGNALYDLLNEYQKAYDEAKQTNEQRYQDILFGYQGRQQQYGQMATDYGNQLTGGFDQRYQQGMHAANQYSNALMGGYQNQFDRNLGRIAGQNDTVNQGYANRYGRGTGMAQQFGNQLQGGFNDRAARNIGRIEQTGAQERKDLDRRYNEMQANLGQDMVSRGLTGSTIAPTMRARLEEDRGDAIGRLNDRLLRERVSVDSALTGDALQALANSQNRVLNTDIALSGQALGALQQGNAQMNAADMALSGQALGQLAAQQNRNLGMQTQLSGDALQALSSSQNRNLQTGMGLSGDTLGFMERRTDAYPDPRLLASLAQGMGAAGYGAAPRVDPFAGGGGNPFGFQMPQWQMWHHGMGVGGGRGGAGGAAGPAAVGAFMRRDTSVRSPIPPGTTTGGGSSYAPYSTTPWDFAAPDMGPLGHFGMMPPASAPMPAPAPAANYSTQDPFSSGLPTLPGGAMGPAAMQQLMGIGMGMMMSPTGAFYGNPVAENMRSFQ